jgi:hypothetical protein
MDYNKENHSPETYNLLKAELNEKFKKAKWIDVVKATIVSLALTVPIQAIISPFTWGFLGINIGIASDCVVAGKRIPDFGLFGDAPCESETHFNPIGMILVTLFLLYLMYPYFFRVYRAKRHRGLWIG